MEQVVHESVKKAFENLQKQRLQNLSGKPVSVLSYCHSKSVFPDIQEEQSIFQSVPICPVTGQHLFFAPSLQVFPHINGLI